MSSHLFPRCLTVFALSFLLVGPGLRAQDSGSGSAQAQPRDDTKTFVTENGTQSVDRSLETQTRKTKDGEVVIQRYRAPGYGGDNSVTWEREVRTRKLPDGTIEKETILRHPDGANRLQPSQITREKITKSGDTTTTQRDVLAPNYDGEWQPIQKQTITEKGADKAKQSVNQIHMRNAGGDWQVVEQQTTSTRTGADGATVTHSVRQVPDSSGQLADYERRDERTIKKDGKESREITLRRRDLSDTEGRNFLLIEGTKESTVTKDGATVRHTTTESDLLSNGVIRNPSGHAEVVQESTQRETVARDGNKQVVTSTSVREPGNPSELRPAPTVVQKTDSKGYVRQIFIPAQ